MRVCRNCNVRIEQRQINGGMAWMHVKRWNAGGSEQETVYRVCERVLVAEP